MSSIRFGKRCWQNINCCLNEYVFFLFKTIDRFYSRFWGVGYYLADIINHDSLATFCQIEGLELFLLRNVQASMVRFSKSSNLKR